LIFVVTCISTPRGETPPPIDTREKGLEDWSSEVTAGLINLLDAVEGWTAASSDWPNKDTERQRAAMPLRAQSLFIKISFGQIAGSFYLSIVETSASGRV
jgi:hypothetical protein